MSENWGVVSFWVKLWAFAWLLLAQLAGITIRRFFRGFHNLLPRIRQ